jgi:signal peptidase I
VSSDNLDLSALCQEPARDLLSRDQRLSLGRKLDTMRWFRDRLIVVVIAIIISIVIRTFLFSTYAIPSASMEGTLVAGDRIGVSRLTPSVSGLKRGDVVVFTDPGGWLPPQLTKVATPPWWITALTLVGVLPVDSNNHVIKRVIGLPGDHVVCCDKAGDLSVNGKSLPESYVQLPAGESTVSGKPFDVIVPPKSLWVMGDNRYNSADSRFHADTPTKGFVPISDVTGRAFIIMWPLPRITVLPQFSNGLIPGPEYELPPEK